MVRLNSGQTSAPAADVIVPEQIAGVPRNVFTLSIVSYLADVSSEMAYPFIPIFLTTVLGAPVAAVGMIEGVAESTASVLKIISGWWSDRVRRRLPLVVSGYGLAAVGKLLLALAFVWPVVLLARFVDRFGKGMRGSPRDALIADSTPDDQRGRAYGFHRTADTAGAVTGVLLALLLAALLHEQLRIVFAIAFVPGVLSVIMLALVRETHPGAKATHTPPPSFSLRGFDRHLLVFLVGASVFAIGNSSDVFLILRAKNLGMSTTATVLAYVLYNLVYMGASLPAGIISDRSGRRNLFVGGLVVFALVYAGFALADRPADVWPLFAVYGLYMALTEGVSKALITDLAPKDRRATALGVFGMVTGIAALVASVAAGQLWDHVGVAAPFALGAAAALAGALVVLIGLPRRSVGAHS